MISILLIVVKILLWIVVIYIGFIILLETVGRLIRLRIPSPFPGSAISYLDNSLRRRMQPPAQVVDWIGIQNGMHVLEIGPGPGTFTLEASKQVGEKGELSTVDIQPIVAKILDRRLRGNGITHVKTNVARADQLPFPDKTFDRVFMIAVMGEFPDKTRALVEIKRVLKDDGLLAIGEFLPDLDYPLKRTVIRWCKDAGLKLVNTYGGVLHYVLTFGVSGE